MIKFNEDCFFEMVNKSKSKTGLPMNIYLSIQPQNKKDGLLRVKLQNNYADQFTPHDCIEVVIFYKKNFEYKLINENKTILSNKEIQKAVSFVKINLNMILQYWEGLLSSDDLILKKI